MRGTNGPGRPSILLYAHEGHGIGHLRVSLTLAEYLRTRWPSMGALLVAGSRGAMSLRWPEGLDWIKLPDLVRTGAQHSDEKVSSPTRSLPGRALMDIRRDMLLSIVRHFAPDLLLVDWNPSGPVGELVPALRHLKTHAPSTTLVLGLCDILDDSRHLRPKWSCEGAYELLERVYDRIFVYGQRDVFDLAAEAGLSPSAAAKVRYTGYLRREVRPGEAERVRAGLGLGSSRLVLVTVGGGEAGGERVLAAMLEAMQLAGPRPGFECVVVAGPLLSQAKRAPLQALAGASAAVQFLDAVPDLAPYVAAADVVVARAGYNTVCELLSFQRPAVLVPLQEEVHLQDTPAGHRQEQRLRAEALERRGLARMVAPQELSPARLLAEVRGLLEEPLPARDALDLAGLPTVAAELEALLASDQISGPSRESRGRR